MQMFELARRNDRLVAVSCTVSHFLSQAPCTIGLVVGPVEIYRPGHCSYVPANTLTGNIPPLALQLYAGQYTSSPRKIHTGLGESTGMTGYQYQGRLFRISQVLRYFSYIMVRGLPSKIAEVMPFFL